MHLAYDCKMYDFIEKFVVIDDKKSAECVEFGTYEELMSREGEFFKLKKQQS